jgi:hypothetical protein
MRGIDGQLALFTTCRFRMPYSLAQHVAAMISQLLQITIDDLQFDRVFYMLQTSASRVLANKKQIKSNAFSRARVKPTTRCQRDGRNQMRS